MLYAPWRFHAGANQGGTFNAGPQVVFNTINVNTPTYLLYGIHLNQHGTAQEQGNYHVLFQELTVLF